jgi:type IV pilus assembly protein PilC
LEIYLQSLGKEMPAMTQNLMDGSFWLRQNIIYVCEILAVAAVTLIAIYRTNKGRFEIDRWALRIPLFGKLLRLRENISFARSVSMMLKSGITLTEALGTVVQMTDNHYMNRTINLARTKIVQGSNLTDALNDRFAFTPMLQQMVAVGQQSGELETVLAEVAELHESQFKTTVKRLNSILAPLMTFFIGGIVGYVYIAFFVALFSAGT